jgi:para-nitrobenzyl esterase
VFGALGERSPFGFRVDDIPGERAFAELMMTAWTNFAKAGNPSIAGVVDWPAHAPDKPSYVVLGRNISVVRGLRDERVELISRAYERRRAGQRQHR